MRTPGAGLFPPSRLYLEATHLKTVPTVVSIPQCDLSGIEAQAVGIEARDRRRPTEPELTVAIQRTGAVMAAARRRVPQRAA